MLNAAPLTLDDNDPRVTSAEAAEKQLYDFYGISYVVRYILLPRHGIKVRITETGEGDPVVIVPGNTGDSFPFVSLLPHLHGRRIVIINRPGGGLSEGMDHTTVDFHDFAVETLTNVFDALGLDRAPIIAHSMGGHGHRGREQPLWLQDRVSQLQGVPIALVSFRYVGPFHRVHGRYGAL